MRFTTRQKFSLIFSIYVSVFIILVGAIFLLILHTILTYQIQKDTTAGAIGALKNHIAVEKDAVTVIPDKTGGLLSDEIIELNISVLILDNGLNVVHGYGLLELYNQGDQESVKTIAKMAQDAESSLKPTTGMIPWRGQNLSVYVAPIKSSGKAYGAIVAAKSLSQVESLEEIILLTLIGLTVAGILVSLFLSRLVVKRIFKPIHNLTEIISATDLDKLDKTLLVPGSKSDELVILGDKFNEMMVRLKSMSEQQKEFITNASHELKTPLSRAISSLDLALSASKPDYQTFLDIRNDLFEINNLLDKLMFLSKLRPGTILPSERLSLNKLVRVAIETFKKELDNKKMSILADLGLDATIFIPKEYAKILLGNLLSNAIKYGKEHSTISIRTHIASQKAVLTITDRGLGIQKSDLKRVGERFYRGAASGQNILGHGIGLSIVKRITELYKLRLSIKSETNEGTEVTLEFPINI